jgi:hypothetical protein
MDRQVNALYLSHAKSSLRRSEPLYYYLILLFESKLKSVYKA